MHYIKIKQVIKNESKKNSSTFTEKIQFVTDISFVWQFAHNEHCTLWLDFLIEDKKIQNEMKSCAKFVKTTVFNNMWKTKESVSLG